MAQETKLEKAKRLSLGYWNREEKDVLVLFPSESVYVGTKPEALEEYAITTGQEIVVVKSDGILVEENNATFHTVELKKEPAFGQKKEKKKL